MAKALLLLMSACLGACGPEETSRAPRVEPRVERNAGGIDAAEDVSASSTTRLPAAPKISACLLQDGVALSAKPLRAVGTEPFWGARIEGRCVTYSHPDDQAGTRIWTRWSREHATDVWKGMLGGKPFAMRIRPQPGCSDGMSDERYPFAASLTIGGEEFSGCALPL